MSEEHLKAIWPLNAPVSLGNLLTIRKELELLMQSSHQKKASIQFEHPESTLSSHAPYYLEALSSKYAFDFCYNTAPSNSFDCPIEEGDYGSLKRIAKLSKTFGVFPKLSWPNSIHEQAKALYHSFPCSSGLFAIHLKSRDGGKEMSNANLSTWHKLFEEKNDVHFILLGHDPVDPSFRKLPNVLIASERQVPLSVQLCFCQHADAFMGMASGICSAAIFSPKPYIIFKHPAHHKEEMEFELGSSNHFPFALKNQMLLRKEDTFSELLGGFESLTKALRSEA